MNISHVEQIVLITAIDLKLHTLADRKHRLTEDGAAHPDLVDVLMTQIDFEWDTLSAIKERLLDGS